MRIVVYGAAGCIGSVFDQSFGGDHDLRLVDRTAMDEPKGTFVAGDVREPDMFLATLDSADASVYLPFASHYSVEKDLCNTQSGDSFDVNLRGVYYWLAAAHEKGVRRLVFASSLSIYGYPNSDGLTEKTLPHPENIYGLTKMLGEEVCRYFVTKYTMDLTVLRLCSVHDEKSWTAIDPSNRAVRLEKVRVKGVPATHVYDAVESIRLGLTQPLEGFNVFHIFGESGVRDWPTDDACNHLGFSPKYTVFGVA